MIKKISEIIPGDIVSEDIYNINGKILVKKGDSLNKKLIHILKIWGIRELLVASRNNKDSSAVIFQHKNISIPERDHLNKYMQEILKTASFLKEDV